MKDRNFGNFCVGSRTRNNGLKRGPRRSSWREQLCGRHWQSCDEDATEQLKMRMEEKNLRSGRLSLHL